MWLVSSSRTKFNMHSNSAAERDTSSQQELHNMHLYVCQQQKCILSVLLSMIQAASRNFTICICMYAGSALTVWLSGKTGRRRDFISNQPLYQHIQVLLRFHVYQPPKRPAIIGSFFPQACTPKDSSESKRYASAAV